MKKTLTLIVGTAFVLGIYAIPVIAQPAAQPQAAQVPPPTRVMVVDVAQLIRNHPEFTAKQDGLKAQVQQAEADFTKRQEGIINKQKALEASQFKPGTPDHQRMLDEITRDMAQFEADAKSRQRQFALANSRIMYDTYKDIKSTIGRIATQYGIAQVTDYRVFEVDPADPTTVAEDMDQRLVWFNPSLNMTNTVIQQLYADRQLPMPTTLNSGTPSTNPQTATTPGAQVQR